MAVRTHDDGGNRNEWVKSAMHPTRLDARDVTALLELEGLPIATDIKKCPGGWFGWLLGHKWLTVRQIAPQTDPQDARPFKVYTTQRCYRCHQENAEFNRVYAP